MNIIIESIKDLERNLADWSIAPPAEPFHTGATHIDFMLDIKQCLHEESLKNNPDYLMAVDPIILKHINDLHFGERSPFVNAVLSNLSTPEVNESLDAYNAAVMIAAQNEDLIGGRDPMFAYFYTLGNILSTIYKKSSQYEPSLLAPHITPILDTLYIVNSVLIGYLKELNGGLQ